MSILTLEILFMVGCQLEVIQIIKTWFENIIPKHKMFNIFDGGTKDFLDLKNN